MAPRPATSGDPCFGIEGRRRQSSILAGEPGQTRFESGRRISSSTRGSGDRLLGGPDGGDEALGRQRPSSVGGLPRAVSSRMKLDATMSPSMTSLRLNPQNLRNEARIHKGRHISVQLASLRPKQRPCWAGPVEMKLSRADRILVRKAKMEGNTSGGSAGSRRASASAPGVTSSSQSLLANSRLGGGDQRVSSLVNTHNRTLTEARHTTEYVSWSKRVTEASTSALADIQTRKLMAKPRMQQVFNLLQDSSTGFLLKDQLDRALKAVGSSVLEENLESYVINEVFETLPEGTTGLTFREFCTVVAALNERRHMALRERFEELDKDNSGEISLQEFRNLIWDLGFTVNQQEVEKLFAEVDVDGSGFVDFDEFEQAVSNSLENYGFTREEVHEFEGLFDRYDQDRSGRLSPDELASALGWFGTPTSIAQAEELFELCGHFNNEPLTKSEFLRVMRIRLQQQITIIRAQFAANDVDGSGTLDVQEVGDMLIELGYSTSQEALRECIRRVRTNAGKRGLVFEEVLELVEQLRRCEGFSEREVADLEQVFRLQDPGNRGCLREFELGYALQWLGYGIPGQRRFLLMCAADVDKTGTIEFGEFLKVMRMVQENEAKAVRDFLGKHGSRRTFSEVAFKELVSQLGYSPPKAFLNQTIKSSLGSMIKDLELDDILPIVKRVRNLEASKRQQCAGLPEEQAARVRTRFGRKAEAGKVIDPTDAVRFILDVYPKARHKQADYMKLEELTREVSLKDGGLKLSDIFLVMQRFRHYNDEKQWQLQLDIANRAKFSPQQVATFRELYISGNLDTNGTLSLEEFLTMLKGNAFSSLSPEGRQEMWRHANERDGAENIDFAVFLELMQTGWSSVRLESQRRTVLSSMSRAGSKSVPDLQRGRSRSQTPPPPTTPSLEAVRASLEAAQASLEDDKRASLPLRREASHERRPMSSQQS